MTGMIRPARIVAALAVLACALVALVTARAAGTFEVSPRPTTAEHLDFVVSVRAGGSSKDLVTPITVRRGELLTVRIQGKLKPGWHTYPITQRSAEQDESQLTRWRFKDASGLKPLWPVTETQPEWVAEDKKALLEYDEPFEWSRDIFVLPDAKPGSMALGFHLTLGVCDDQHCTYGTYQYEVPLTISEEPPLTPSPAVTARLKDVEPPIQVLDKPNLVTPKERKALEAPKPTPSPKKWANGATRGGEAGLWAFVLQGIIWGAISLVTPCVFPMIPITVSFFLKQSEKEHHRPIFMASIYCVTIVVVLTTSAVALLSVFQAVSTHPVTNYAMGALFIFFALSLLGMYEIELPHSLAQYTSSREGQGGVAGTIFMALTFTIISFACVAPFLGGFGGTAGGESGLSWSHRVLGGLAFSATFASPFFVLALFPSLLKRMPKSGNWLNSVKVVMGFLELAAALKFCRAGERVWLAEPTLFTFDFVLAAYVGIALLSGLYLLGVYRLPHDSPTENLGVLRVLFGLSFISLAVYIAPGLMKSYDRTEEKWHNQRSSGAVYAWVESFLLPDSFEDLPWIGNLDRGLVQAREKKQRVLLDFTGVTCTNCTYNEQNVFTRTAVRDLLRKYTLVQLYTDRVPNHLYPTDERSKLGSGTARQTAEGEANRAFQGQRFNDTQLPLYVILEPLADGGFREVARYNEGKINNPEDFEEFLRYGLTAAP